MGEAARKEPEEKFVIVGPGAADLPDSMAPAKSEDLDKPDEEEKKPAADARLGGGRDEEPEPNERTRETSRERRERQKRSRERERVEKEFYKTRNEALEQRLMRLEGRTSQAEVAANEQRVNALKTQIANAGRVITDSLAAIATGDKDARGHLEQARQIESELQRELNRLEFAKEQHQAARPEQQARAPQQQQQPQRQSESIDPIAASLGRKWIRAHDWFDPSGSDEDSEIVLMIDERLKREGFDPADDEYWDELSARVKRRLPEKFKANGARRRDEEEEEPDDEEERPRSSTARGPRFSSGGRERPLKKGEVYVSAERKEAMKLAGAWDDPVVRQRLLKRYAEMDTKLATEKSNG